MTPEQHLAHLKRMIQPPYTNGWWAYAKARAEELALEDASYAASADAAACGARADQDGSRVLTSCEKAAIEASVDRALKECFTRNDGCNYPFGSLEERHWTACFVMKGGKL